MSIAIAKLRLVAAAGALSLAALAAQPAMATTSFSDDFNAGASAQWSNSSGAWSAAGGIYRATDPNNMPTTYTGLGYDFTDFTLTVDALSVGDSGIYLRTDGTNQNGVLLVLGGLGYGQGQRGGAIGTALYFHIIQNGGFSGPLDEVDGVMTPGSNHAIKVTVTGNLYQVSVDNVLKTSLTTNLFADGRVGLYDDQPNAHVGATGTPSAFDNFSVSGEVVGGGAVPEPTGWALMILGFGLAGAALRRRTAALAR